MKIKIVLLLSFYSLLITSVIYANHSPKEINKKTASCHYIEPIEEDSIHYSPLVIGYIGNIGCANSEMVVTEKVLAAIEDEEMMNERITTAIQAVEQKCISTKQVREIADVFSMESDKLEFSKGVMSNIYDIDDIYKLNDMLSQTMQKKSLDHTIDTMHWSSYGIAYGKPYVYPVVEYHGRIGSFLPIIDHERLTEIIDNQTFFNDKIHVANQALAQKSLTVDQFVFIAENGFNSEMDRLKFAKAAKPRIIDIDDFIKAEHLFSFKTNIDAFHELIAID